MATTVDPAILQGSDPRAIDGIASGAWRRIALLILAGMLVSTIAAWLGYQRHVGPQPGLAGDSPAPSTTRQSGRAADGVTRGLGANEEIVIDAAQAERRAGLQWPMWEFRLRQPIPPRDPSLTPPTWRLIGSALSAGKWAVIVLRQGSTTPEYFTVGQDLPGGYRIESINDEDVTLAQGKRLMVLSYIGSR